MTAIMPMSKYSAHTDKLGRKIPKTTEGACQRYNATTSACDCPDHTHREGGTYQCLKMGDSICKHMYFRRIQFMRASLALRHVPRMAYLEI